MFIGSNFGNFLISSPHILKFVNEEYPYCVEFFNNKCVLLRNINVIQKPAFRLSYVILIMMLTAMLISSPVIAVFSPSPLPPIALRVEFASATSSSENNDDNEGEEEQLTTDVTTNGEEEEVDGDGDVQEEDNTEEEQEDEDGGDEDGEQEQFASVVGEVCDDFEDNDGDGFIDLVDADCAAPLTEGTVTAPTTPPPPSVVNTTATNSTANTLTGSGIAGLDRPYDLEKDCKTLEEQGIPPPPPEPGDPPNVKWYDCPPGVLVRDPPRAAAADTTTTTTTTSGVEVCDDFEDNDGDGFIDLVDADCAAPLTEGTVTAPTTPSRPPPSSVANTTNNSTDNTLTSGSIGIPPPRAADGADTTATTTTTTDSDTGREVCDNLVDDDDDGLIDSTDADCAAPLTEGAVTTSAPTTTVNDDNSTTTTYPDGVSVTSYPNGVSVTNYTDGVSVWKNGVPTSILPAYRSDRDPPTIPAPGHTLTIFPGGAKTMETPDGQLGFYIPGLGSAIINPDGTSSFRPDGMDSRRITLQPAGTQQLLFLTLLHLSIMPLY